MSICIDFNQQVFRVCSCVLKNEVFYFVLLCVFNLFRKQRMHVNIKKYWIILENIRIQSESNFTFCSSTASYWFEKRNLTRNKIRTRKQQVSELVSQPLIFEVYSREFNFSFQAFYIWKERICRHTCRNCVIEMVFRERSFRLTLML